MKTCLNTDRRTFLVQFDWKNTDSIYIFQNGNDLIELLKNNDKPIKFIKEFDRQSYSFKRVSKKDLLNVFSWDTETDIYLNNNHYFFKK